MRNRKDVTEADIKQIIHLYVEEKLYCRTISLMLNIGRHIIVEILKNEGIEIKIRRKGSKPTDVTLIDANRYKNINIKQINEIKRLYEIDLKDCKEIAPLFNLTRREISEILKLNGVKVAGNIRSKLTEEEKTISKERHKKQIAEYRIVHAEEIKKQTKAYRENNKNKVISKEEKEKKNKKVRINRAKRMKNDPVFKLRHRIKNAIMRGIKKRGLTKSYITEKILGCTFKEFAEYIKSKFETWMTWDNYGVYTGNFNETWCIDHIIPMDTAITEDDVYRLNHYTNLQPLCSKINQDIKGSRLDWTPEESQILIQDLTLN